MRRAIQLVRGPRPTPHGGHVAAIPCVPSKTHVRKHWGGWFFWIRGRKRGAGVGPALGRLGPKKVRGMRGNTNRGSVLYSSGKISIFRFSISTGCGPFQRHSRVIRGAVSAPVADPTQTLGTVRSRVPAPGCRPVRGVTRRHSERPRGRLQTCSSFVVRGYRPCRPGVPVQCGVK